MDKEAIKLLMVFKNVSEALLTGLKTAVFVLEKEDRLTPERRETLISQMKGLIEHGEKAFEKVPPLQ